MPTQETPEAVVHDAEICLRANARADQRPTRTDILTVATNNVVLNGREIGHTSGQEVRSGLAEHVLDTLGEQ